MWTPSITGHDGPKYAAIADAIAGAVEAGTLAVGTQLPPQRELADQLGVTVGTVSRGYDEARRRGLVTGEVGRGTFVRGTTDPVDRIALAIPESGAPGLIDMSRNYALLDARHPALERAVKEFGRRLELGPLLNYQPQAGAPRDREAGAKWLQRFGMPAQPDEVVVTCGAQHALVVVLAALVAPGDVVLAEQLAYPGIRGAARMLHAKLEAVALDDDGLRPDAFEAACEELAPKAVVVTPTVQNPTGSVISAQRRQQIAAIARRYDVAVIEDDTYAFLVPDAPPPITTLLPERGYYLSTLAKAIIPGLRIGYVWAPATMRDAVGAGVMTTTWMPAPAMASLATALIEQRVVDEVLAWKRHETDARLQIAKQALGDRLPDVRHRTLHLWLPLPEPWRAEEFVARARVRGVELTAPGQFVVGRRHAVPQAVRVCIGAPRDRSALQDGLEVLADLLSRPPPPHAFV